MPHSNRTLSVKGEKIPISPYGTAFLMVHTFTGHESVNDLFDYKLILRTRDEYYNPAMGEDLTAQGSSPGSNWQLQTVVGSLVTVAVELDGKIDFPALDNAFGRSIDRLAGVVLGAIGGVIAGAGTRYFNGFVSSARVLGVEGRSQLYELTLRPWLWLLTQNADYRVNQQQNVIQIIDAVLKKYPYPVEWRVSKEYPILDFDIQYGSSDLDYIKSLCEEHGLNFWFEHDETGHCVVIADNLGAFKSMSSAAYHDIFTYPPSSKIQEEFITQFDHAQSIVAGHVLLNDYQFKAPHGDQSSTSRQPWDTAHNQTEFYHWHQGDYLGRDNGGQVKAGLRMEALRQHGLRAVASGNLRGVEAGHVFNLKNHPTHANNRGWIVLSTQLHMQDIAPETNQLQYEVKVQFTMQPDNEVVRPDLRTPKPQARLQTAIVTTPEQQELWTDRYGRVKIKFHWDRYGTSDEHASCWVRVASSWAGANYGHIQIPRKDQEVLVDFIGGDPDMPIITGRVTNPEHMSLWDLPSQRALSGFKSKEIDGNQNNHFIMDDTREQIQVQLASDHQASALNLGYVTRIPDVSGRADYRGEGFELRTDAWGAIRANRGLLVTTYGKNQGSGMIKDASETISILKHAQSQQKTMGQMAIDHQAESGQIDAHPQNQLQRSNQGIQGAQVQTATSKSNANTSPELSDAHLIISSPEGIHLATPKTTHIAANEHIALTSQQDTSLSVGKRLLASVQKGISLFTATTGIKLFAARDKIEIQAQNDNIEIIADKVMKLISAKESIEIAAKKEILLTAGTSYIKINASGIEHGTMGAWTAYAGSHGLPGPKMITFPINPLVQLIDNDANYLVDIDSNLILPNRKYRIIDPINGWEVVGISDFEGRISDDKNVEDIIEVLPNDFKNNHLDNGIPNTLTPYFVASSETNSLTFKINKINTIKFQNALAWYFKNNESLRQKALTLGEKYYADGVPMIPENALLISDGRLLGNYKKGKGPARYALSFDLNKPNDQLILDAASNLALDQLPTQYFYIFVHANPDLFQLSPYTRKTYNLPKLLYKKDILKHKKQILRWLMDNSYRSSDTVVCTGCQSGNTEDPIAKHFAQIMGIGTIYAPTSLTWYSSKNEILGIYGRWMKEGEPTNVIAEPRFFGHFRIFNAASISSKARKK